MAGAGRPAQPARREPRRLFGGEASWERGRTEQNKTEAEGGGAPDPGAERLGPGAHSAQRRGVRGVRQTEPVGDGPLWTSRGPVGLTIAPPGSSKAI